MNTRQGNFLYYNIADLICSGVFVVLAGCTVIFWANEQKTSVAEVKYCLLIASCIFGLVAARYSVMAVDNKFSLLLLIPLKLLLAGVFLLLGFFAIGSFLAALDKEHSKPERLAHAARGAAATAATGFMYHFIKQYIKH